jgi:hypothetical protein
MAVAKGEEDAKDDVPQAEPQEPEEDAMADDKAVHYAQQQFDVAEQGKARGGVVSAIDEGKAIEDQHKGGCDAIVTLLQHGKA